MLMKNLDDLDTNGIIGDWCFIANDSYIIIRYAEDPFKGSVVLSLSGEHGWKWNENKECPTLTPSILIHAHPNWTDGWHGFLTDGKLITV